MNNFTRLAFQAVLCLFSIPLCFSQSFTDLPGPMGTTRSILQGTQGEWYIGSSSKGVFRSLDKGLTWSGLGGNTIMAGRINDLIYDAANQIVAATEQGGIKVWNGSAWSNLGAGLATGCSITLPIRALALDPQGNLYAGAHAFGACFSAGDLYRLDGGMWTSIAAGLPNKNINALAVDPVNGELVAGTQGGIFRRSGQQWTALGTGLPDSVVHCLLFTPAGDLWVGTNRGPAFLPHSSSAWTLLKTGLPNGFPVQAIALSDTPERLVLSAGFENDQPGPLYGRLFESSDGGLQWNQLGHPESTVVRAVAYMGAQAWLAAGWGILQSNDDAQHWERSNAGFSAKAFNTQGRIAVSSAPEHILFYGTDEGLFRSLDEGQTWAMAGNGLTRPIVTQLKADRQGNLFCGVMRYLGDDYPGFGDGKLYYSADKGGIWQEAQISKDWRYMEISELPDGRLICAHGFGAQPPSATIIGSSLAISSDQGRNWTDLNVSAGMAFCCTADSIGNMFVAGESQTVFRSTDGGAHFDLIVAPGQQGNVGTLEAGPNGAVLMGSGGVRTLFFSNDYGASYTTFTSTVLPDYRGVNDAVFDDQGKAYCTTTGAGGAPALFSIAPPFTANAVFQPIPVLGGSLFKMTWDDCGRLYIYRGGGILRSTEPLRAPEGGCLPSNTREESTGNILLSPNPAGAVLHLDIIDEEGPWDLRVWDAQGRLLSVQSVSGDVDLPVGDWAPGLYFLQAKSKNGKVLSGKWVKNG